MDSPQNVGPGLAKAPTLAEKVLFLFEFTQPNPKWKLRVEQHKLYSLVREWRSGNLLTVHKQTSRLNGEPDLPLRTMGGRVRRMMGRQMLSFSGKEAGFS